MFRTAELGSTISKEEYNDREPLLRRELLDLQCELRMQKEFPVIVVFAGVDGAGKAQTVNLLNEWMDPRWLVTRAYDKPSDEERERPEYWRFWRDLPPRGRIGLFLSSWYSRPVLDRVYGKTDMARFVDRLDRAVAFEHALAEDGALVVKFWMHLSREAQERRLKCLERDPLERWRVTKRHWKHWHMYDGFIEAAERVIMRTSTGKAPWHIVEGIDPFYRSLTVGTLLRDALASQLERVRLEREVKARLVGEPARGRVAATDTPDNAGEAFSAGDVPVVSVLHSLDMTQALDKKDYQQQLKQHQARLNLLSRQALKKKISTIVLLEGPDAGGKGGAVRRITAALDARNYQVIPIAAPSDEEKARHYLWRFWRHLSRAGRVTIFDRSWYGRVLVERVENLASAPEWKRAYAEINDFEEQLVEHGMVLVKYWLHISSDEQLARFKAREETPHKRWKITDEDWRNRERWADYDRAVNDMVQQTSTLHSPWTLVEGNDKRFARVKVIRTLCAQLEGALRKV
ncbi:MAG: polyphosphate:AMP phosphotransferase [Gammaproteobacteria bacterium]|jgi:polyphosphate:AMP phosphotransferase